MDLKKLIFMALWSACQITFQKCSVTSYFMLLIYAEYLLFTVMGHFDIFDDFYNVIEGYYLKVMILFSLTMSKVISP